MSTLTLPLSQPREVTRRRLSLRRIDVAATRAPSTPAASAAAALETVKSAVAALPARLEALMRDARGGTTQGPAPVPLDTLMQGAQTLPILHNGDVYTLRITRYGKLILTK